MVKSISLWNSMIGIYGDHGQGQQADSLFTCMIGDGVVPNETTFVALLNALTHSGINLPFYFCLILLRSHIVLTSILRNGR